MWNLLKAENYKLLRNRVFWGMAASTFLLGSLLLLDSKRQADSLFYASLYNTPLLFFLAIIFTALFTGNDFTERTLHCFISAGHRRSAVLFTKIFVCQSACFLILMLPLSVHGLMGILIHRITFFSWNQLIQELIAVFFAVFAMCMFPLFCAFLFRDMGKTLAVPMISYFLMIFVLNSDKSKLVGVILPMGQLRLISMGQLPITMTAVAAIDILWILILYTGAYICFRRSDLK